MSARRSIKLCGVWLCVGTQAAAAQPPPEAPVPELVGGTFPCDVTVTGVERTL